MGHKYESDMTKKEKRQWEKEKLKSLGFAGKLEYFWMYYKVWLAVAAVAAVILYLGVSAWQGKKENILLNVAVAGGNSQDEERIKELELDIKKALGAKGKYDTVKVQANIPEDGGDLTSRTALTTLIGANAIDILVCSEAVYEEYQEQGGFEEQMLVLKNAEALNINIEVAYDPVYVCIMINAEHRENAERIMEYLTGLPRERE